jgi:steroid delta-isomerase-like uncharacterized protein
MVEQFMNQHDLGAVNVFFAPHFVNHTPVPGFSPTRDGLQAFFAMFFTAFPDVQVTIEDQAAEGDKVWTRKTLVGTHQGDFMGLVPTGKQVRYEIIDILRLEQGQITAHWAVTDQLSLLQQLGALSP